MSAVNKKNLIINYLPQTLTDEEFTSLFASVGQLASSKIIRDRSSGYSYGFGFVEYQLEQDAASAIELLNGTQLQSKTIKVAYSREGDNVKGANLHIRNIPKTYTADDLKRAFTGFGNIIQCRILNDQSGASRGIGFVLYNTKDEADTALAALNGTIPANSTLPLQICFAEDKVKTKGQTQMATQTAALFNSFSAYNMSTGFGVTPRPLFGIGAAPRGGAARGRGGSRGGPIKSQLPRHRFNPIAVGGGLVTMPTITPPAGQGHIIYAYNIGAQTSEEELQQLFALYGSVSKVDVIWDQQKNQGKGYGFVTMPNYEEAAYAIQCLNGYNYAGKPMQVSFKTQKST